jgi:putative inorganic carbon (HCO3(-)) transporter
MILRRAAARIAANEFWLLWVYGAPLLFASNVPLPFLLGALLTIPFFWIARRVASGVWSRATPLDLPLALLLLVGLVGVGVSNDLQTSAQRYGELLGGVALYYGLVNGLAPSRVSRGVWLLLALGAGFAAFGLLGLRFTGKFIPFPMLDSFLPKVDVSLLNPRGFTPNIVAGAIAPIAPLAFAWAWTQSGARRWGVLGLAAFLAGAVVLTQSRGALLGLGAGLAILLLWRVPHILRVAMLAATLIATILLFTPLRDGGALFLTDSTGTVSGRLELWERALFVMRDFPFTGIGLGTFQANVPVLYPLFENPPGEPQPHAHNIYLQMGVDYGVGGFIAFLALVTTTLGVAIANARRLRSAAPVWLAMGLLAGCVAFLTHGLLDAIFLSTKVSMGVWMLLGLIMVLRRVNE